MTITLFAVPDVPLIRPGDDLAAIIINALEKTEFALQTGDILALAQKIVSKTEGRLVRLAEVEPSPKALEVAEQTQKDARLVELILQESDEISRMRPGLLIVRHRLGFTSANAGIDRSNVAEGEEETVLLLPVDPDGSAEQLRQTLLDRLGVTVGVIITDSHGRPFRMGTVGVAIGAAGIPALWDRRGEFDLFGYELQHTDVGVADELAAAAGLLMGQANEGLPVVIMRGVKLPAGTGTSRDLIRPKEKDLYR